MSQTFAELGVSNAVSTALAERGMESPFAIQELVLPDALDGRDVLVASPTGSGKTIAFGVALVEGIEAEDPRPSALVLVPTRELATQIVDEIREIAHSRALAITAVFGGAGIEKQARLATRSHILVATPGRLEDLLQRRAVSLADVKMLVLDEADRMLDMGFQPAVKRIVSQCRTERQTLFLSATLDGRVGEIARAYTRDPKLIEFAGEKRDEGNIEHRFRQVTRDDKVEHLVDQLKDRDRGLAVVFVKTKFGADKLVRKLAQYKVPSVALHGNRSQAQRRKALAAFEEGEVTTLVATDVAARGLDVDDVTHVIQYDIPVDMETYTHRVGRTGRAGRTGIGVTFVEPEERLDMGVMARDLKLGEQLEAAGMRVGAPGEKGPGVQRKQGARAPRGDGGGGRGGQGGRGPRQGQSRSDHQGGGGFGGRSRGGESGGSRGGRGGASGGRSGGRQGQGGRGGR
jgi:superfamily II DNA/RNA helicase